MEVTRVELAKDIVLEIEVPRYELGKDGDLRCEPLEDREGYEMRIKEGWRSGDSNWGR